MELPVSGRTVIIDDTPEEALPLIEALQKNAVPYLYYDGEPDKFPKKSLSGIRIIFLDIVLKGMTGQDNKTIASGLAGRLKKLISERNGPYSIIFWTKHQEIIDKVLEYCSKGNIPPVCWIDMEKKDCKANGEDGYDINKIFKKLEEKLKSNGAFNLYIEWENNLHRSSSEFVYEFSSLIPYGDQWSLNTSKLFYKLYKTYVEKNELRDTTERFKCASMFMNRSYFDALQRYTQEHLKLPPGFNLSQGGIADGDIIAKLNKSLFLTDQLLKRPSPGYVFSCENKPLLNSLTKSMFKNEAPNSYELCLVIITPECDIAQNKLLKHSYKNYEADYHRIVYGVILPYKDFDRTKIKKSTAVFKIGPFWHKGQKMLIFLNFGTLSFEYGKRKLNAPMFSLRRDLLFDIQSKAANHVNRLGNFQLG